MSIADEIIGTHYRYPDYFQVGRQKVGEYARADAAQADDDDLPAEATAVVRQAPARVGAPKPASLAARRPMGGDQSGTAELSLNDLQAMSESRGREDEDELDLDLHEEHSGDSELPELAEEAKTRQVKLVDVQGAPPPDDYDDTADTDPPPGPTGDGDDDDDDDDAPMTRPRDEATMKIAFADIQPPPGGRSKRTPTRVGPLHSSAMATYVGS